MQTMYVYCVTQSRTISIVPKMELAGNRTATGRHGTHPTPRRDARAGSSDRRLPAIPATTHGVRRSPAPSRSGTAASSRTAWAADAQAGLTPSACRTRSGLATRRCVRSRLRRRRDKLCRSSSHPIWPLGSEAHATGVRKSVVAGGTGSTSAATRFAGAVKMRHRRPVASSLRPRSRAICHGFTASAAVESISRWSSRSSSIAYCGTWYPIERNSSSLSAQSPGVASVNVSPA